MNERLHLHEELLLLGLHDAKGKLTAGMTKYAMAGGILAELLLEQRIEIEPGKRMIVEVLSDDPVANDVVDDALFRMASAKRRAALSTWVGRIAGTKKLVARTADGLCKRRILREEDARVLLLFKTKRWPTRDAGPEHEVVERIERTLSTSSLDVDERTLALVALSYRADLLRAAFRRDWLKLHKGRVENLIRSSEVGDAVRSAIEAAQAAMMTAIMASVAVTTR